MGKIVFSAVKNNGSALKHAPADLRAEPDIVLAAIQQDWMAFVWADPCRQVDPVIVSEVIQQNSSAFDFIPNAAWTDHEVVLAAIKLKKHAVICPQAHLLTRRTTKYRDVECDECNGEIMINECLCCLQCDYDVCDQCAQEIGAKLLESV